MCLNNLSEEYDVILNGLGNHLMATGDDALTIDSICEKLNHRYEKIKSKKEEKSEKKHLVHIINNSNSGAGDMVSMATNLAIGDALKIEMKEKKMIRKQNIKTENSMESATTAVRKGI